MRKQYVVRLAEEERAVLRTLISQGDAPARVQTHARILLKANRGEAGPEWTDDAISTALEVDPTTVARVRKLYVTEGLEAALHRKAPDRVYRRKLDGEQEARLVAVACSEPPTATNGGPCGCSRTSWWSWRSSRPSRTRRSGDLKANRLKPWLIERWCIPPAASPEFVYRMEDVLDVYTRPYDPRFPQVCLDETSRQLLADVTPPLPMAPGHPAKEDYEYERRGVVNLFLVCEPLRGWRAVMVSDRRTRIDWAHCIQELVDVHYPDAEKIVLVQDNLNTHTPASLYEAFPPAEAKRLADKLELHYTPKHGSWLNMAERRPHQCRSSYRVATTGWGISWCCTPATRSWAVSCRWSGGTAGEPSASG